MATTSTLPPDAFDLSADEIAGRFRWARERGVPGYLWPDVPPADWRAALEELGRVTAAVLAGRPDPPRLAMPAGGPAALSVAAYTSGMGPLLGCWLDEGLLEAATGPASVLRLHCEHSRRRTLRLDGALFRTLDVLADIGLRPILLKSAHTGRVYFPQPAARPAADIDLAVPPESLEAASVALAAAGYREVRRQRRPPRLDWAPPGAPTRLRSLSLVHADDPYTIDLHGSLERDFFGVRTVRMEPADVEDWPELHPAARVLGQPTLAAYLALHASEGLHALTLLRLVELVLVLRRDGGEGRLSQAELRALLEERGALRFAYPAFVLAERLAPGSVQPELRGALEGAATPRMRRLLRSLQPATAQRIDRLSLDERFMWGRGAVDHARRALHMMWPGRSRGAPVELLRIYRDRVWRVVRLRVGWRGPGRR